MRFEKDKIAFRDSFVVALHTDPNNFILLWKAAKKKKRRSYSLFSDLEKCLFFCNL
ncbi:hypothetical protein MFUM_200055 [Methylacidiphilum fumariolicum SolV]|uniref:Uncharacterized protein n=2 Tax=Candidatus Methylacidiphilum fumarolicum TaxID=591154 RepID=I0JWX1_METFB|nr:conserved protein of unknown function [Candidatus Methylacidiphilum fumarolicum]CCG91740.1 hypothetical protein MFUM_200055 [Methylacidiphilum fumariolicum SolV]